MSSHLLPAYFTTLKYNRKQKRRKSKRLEQVYKDHNKFLKSVGVLGKTTERIASPYNTDLSPVTHSTKTSDKIPSNGITKNKNKYTGTNILGIATMHKSNLVPVTNKKDAEDISKMRRG